MVSSFMVMQLSQTTLPLREADEDEWLFDMDIETAIKCIQRNERGAQGIKRARAGMLDDITPATLAAECAPLLCRASHCQAAICGSCAPRLSSPNVAVVWWWQAWRGFLQRSTSWPSKNSRMHPSCGT